jgi:peptidoglycan/xylan/chitin deacetylase (PgdA/CDA1 family)
MRNPLVILVLLYFFSTSPATADGRIRVIFRYDDYTFIPSPLNDTLLSIFKRNKIPLTLGVIPFDEKGVLINQFDQNLMDDLKARIRNNEIEVALHGFNHQNIVRVTRFKRKYLSEFASADYSEQFYKIRKGKNALDSLLQINIKTFIPPFDTYDSRTLDALTNIGFNIISASIFGATSAVSGNRKIKYMPATTRDFFDLPDLLNRFKDEDVTIIIYFHPYSFRSESLSYSDEYDITRQISPDQLDSLLSQITKQDIDFYTFSGLSNAVNFDKSLYDANYYKDNLVKTVLYKFKRYRYGVYSTIDYHSDHREFMILNLLLHTGIFIVVFFIIMGLVRLFRPGLFVIGTFLAILIISVCAVSYYFIDDSSFKMKLILLLTITLATILGVFSGKKSNLFRKKKTFDTNGNDKHSS